MILWLSWQAYESKISGQVRGQTQLDPANISLGKQLYPHYLLLVGPWKTDL